MMKKMLETNMQTVFPPVIADELSAENVLRGYRQTVAEKPEECTVIPRFDSSAFGSKDREIFVSNGGDDEKGTGAIDTPYATLGRALLDVRDGKGGIIWLRGGNYSSAELDASISASEESPLFIAAYKGERVTFSLGRTFPSSLLVPVKEAAFVTDGERARLDRFTPDNSENVYAIDLTSIGFVQEDFEEYRSGAVSAPMFVGDDIYIVARFPNKDQNDPERKIANGRVLTMNVDDNALNVKKNGRVEWGASTLYQEHKNDEGSWDIYIDDTTYCDRALGYENPYGNLYAYGSVYEEWDVNNFHVSIHEEDGKHYLAHNAPSSRWGCKKNAHTAFYFHNMLEDLDAAGEYLIDTERMILYVYGRPEGEITIVPERRPVISVKDASCVVFQDLFFRYTKGDAVVLEGADHVFLDGCSFCTLGGMGIKFDNAKASGAIYNTFNRCPAIVTVFDKSKMEPTCNIFQNNLFDNENGTQASACMVRLNGGFGDVFSHNELRCCNMSVANQFDLVLEYNFFRNGHQFTRDNGPIYGGVSNRGMHIRHNYICDLNYSRYGIYLDDMASGNYVYCNLIHYREGCSAQCVNLHNGAMTVVDNNLCLNGGRAIINAPNYAAYTVNGERTGAGGGRQSWFAIANSFLYAQFHAGNEAVFRSRYPLYALMNDVNDRSVAKMNANQSWVLLDKISPDEDDEILTRKPAFNVYTNNVTYRATIKGVAIPDYARETCIVENNLEYGEEDDIGLKGESCCEFFLSEDSSVYRDNPNFRPLSVLRAGRTDVSAQTV